MKAQFLPSGAGPFNYNDPANWSNGDINGYFGQTLTANQTVLLPFDLFAAPSIYFGGSYDLIFRGSQSSASSLHLTNNLLFDSVAGRRTVFIGSPTAQNQVEIKLDSGGTFNVGPTDTLILLNRISGSAGLGKVGDGTLVLRGANTYVGGTGIDGGVVEVSADQNLGAVPGTPANNLLFTGNPFTPGVLRLTAAFDIHPNRGIELFYGTGGGIDTNGFNTTYAGSISGDASNNSIFHKFGGGELRLQGTNTYTGTTFVKGGTLAWDYTVNNGSKQATGDVQLTGRSALALIGSNSAPTVQGISNLMVSGNTAIRMTSGAGQSVTFNAGSLQRFGGTLDLTLPATGGIHVNTPDITGVLGYATVDARDWAIRDAGGFLARLPTYDLDSLSAGANSDIATSQAIPTSSAVGSLRFNTPSLVNVALDPAARLTVGTAGRTGGILVTSNVGNNAITISGGQLTADTSDLAIIQNNPAQPMTISSSIVNSAAAIRLTKSGLGTLILTGVNAFTGGTDIADGTLRLSGSGRLPDARPVSLGELAILDLNGISQTIGNFSGGVGSSVLLGGAMLTAGGGRFDGVISGAGGFTKVGNSFQILGGAHTYTGPTVIEGGVLALAGDGILPATTTLTLNAGTAQTGLDLGGRSQLVANLNSSFAGARIFGPGTLTIGSGDGIYAGDFFSSVSLIKDGSGSTTVLTGAGGPASTTLRAGTVAITNRLAVGNLSFEGGTLQFRADLSTDTMAGNILLKSGAAIVDTNGFSGSFAGIISGPGGLTKNGDGTLVIEKNESLLPNTFTGGVTVNGGTLVAATNEALGSALGVVRLNGGALSATGVIPRHIILGATGGGLGSGTAATYSGGVSGLGMLTVNTPGAVTLSTQNTYAGGTQIGPSGALVVTGSFRSLGTGPVTILGGGLLGLTTAANMAPGLLVPLRPGATLAVFNTTIDPAAIIDSDPVKTTGGILALGTPVYDRPLDMATIGNGRLFLSAFGSATYSAPTLGANADGVYRLGAGTALGANTMTISGTDNLLTGARTVIVGSAEATGNATVALLNANDFTGGTTLAGSTLALGRSDSLGSAPVTINGGALKALAALNLANPILIGGDFGVAVSGFAITLNGPVDLGGGTRKITFGSVNFAFPILQINGRITNGALSKSGGNLVLTTANDYAGGTTIIGGGQLRAMAPGALGSGPINLGGNLVLSGAPQVLANPVNVLFANNSISFDTATNLTGPISYASPFAAGIALSGTSPSVTIAGQISDSGGTLAIVKYGSGTIALTGTNSYRGGTTFSDGTIAATSDANLGAVLSTRGNLSFRGGTLRYDAGFTLNPSRSFELQSNSSTAPTIDTNGFDVTIGNAIIGNAGSGIAGPLIKGGAGKLTLTGTNGQFGTTLKAGTLQFNSFAAMGVGTVTMATGTTVAAGYAMNQSFLNKLSKSSNAVVALAVNSGNALDFTGANWRLGAIGAVTFSASLVPNGTTYRLGGGGGTLTLANTNMLTGARRVEIDAGGTIFLAGINNYTGATSVSGSTLKLGASANLPGTASISLANNAIFDVSSIATGFTLGTGKSLFGSGRVAGLLIASSGATVSPGSTAAPFGELTLADFALRGLYAADIDAAGLHDFLQINGNLDLSSATDALTVNVIDTAIGDYVLASYSGTLTGTFNSLTLPPGTAIDYGNGSNSQIRLVPEPGAGMLVLISSLALIGRRRAT